MRLRAGYWYRRTRLQLTDDEAKKKVAARLAQIASIKRPMPIASYCETALGDGAAQRSMGRCASLREYGRA